MAFDVCVCHSKHDKQQCSFGNVCSKKNAQKTQMIFTVSTSRLFVNFIQSTIPLTIAREMYFNCVQIEDTLRPKILLLLLLDEKQFFLVVLENNLKIK